uniref:Uncharacterized protein n=1 Tax=Rhizophora mucronata TaxID=61149 RepID=A0A2P2R3P8_RHIMU
MHACYVGINSFSSAISSNEPISNGCIISCKNHKSLCKL